MHHSRAHHHTPAVILAYPRLSSLILGFDLSPPEDPSGLVRDNFFAPHLFDSVLIFNKPLQRFSITVSRAVSIRGLRPFVVCTFCTSPAVQNFTFFHLTSPNCMYLHFAPMKHLPKRQQQPAIGCDSLSSMPPKSQAASTCRNSSQPISAEILFSPFCTFAPCRSSNPISANDSPRQTSASGGKRHD